MWRPGREPAIGGYRELDTSRGDGYRCSRLRQKRVVETRMKSLMAARTLKMSTLAMMRRVGPAAGRGQASELSFLLHALPACGGGCTNTLGRPSIFATHSPSTPLANRTYAVENRAYTARSSLTNSSASSSPETPPPHQRARKSRRAAQRGPRPRTAHRWWEGCAVRGVGDVREVGGARDVLGEEELTPGAEQRQGGGVRGRGESEVGEEGGVLQGREGRGRGGEVEGEGADERGVGEQEVGDTLGPVVCPADKDSAEYYWFRPWI
ncbi:hypothetical protein B0H13DRAFT_1909729 [Mycena leptocephala]|nr:hypothetical protein B0H13DRAFT_1909729 [Mycena leptocephala]